MSPRIKKSYAAGVFLLAVSILAIGMFILPHKKPGTLSNGNGIISVNWPDSDLNSFTTMTIGAAYDEKIRLEKFPLTTEEFTDLAFNACSGEIGGVWRRGIRQSFVEWKLPWLQISRVEVSKGSRPSVFQEHPLNLGITFFVQKAGDIEASSVNKDVLVLSYRVSRTRAARNYARSQAEFYSATLVPEETTSPLWIEAPVGALASTVHGEHKLVKGKTPALDIITGPHLPSEWESIADGYGSKKEQREQFSQILTRYCDSIRYDLIPDYETAERIERKILEITHE